MRVGYDDGARTCNLDMALRRVDGAVVVSFRSNECGVFVCSQL